MRLFGFLNVTEKRKRKHHKRKTRTNKHKKKRTLKHKRYNKNKVGG